MTWVLGTGSLFGFAALIGDTRVTWPDGRTEDILQKLYPVTPHLMVGFSGSVELGFTMVADMADAFAVDPGEVWSPRVAAWRWWRRGRRRFRDAEDAQRSLGCSLLLVGVSAVRAGMTGFRAYAIRMQSPEFCPEFIPTSAWASIGSGAGSQAALEIARAQSEDPIEFLTTYGQGEVGMGIGGSATMMAWQVARDLVESPLLDVGETVQLGLVTIEGPQIRTVRGQVDLGLPSQRWVGEEPVCRSWEDFRDWLDGDPDAIGSATAAGP